MNLGRAIFATFLAILWVSSSAPQSLAGKKDRAAAEPGDQRRAVHALNRLSFGPRPGDVQQVLAMGIDHWIDQQLHPERIDDSGLSARLEPLATLHMSAKQIAENFPDPQEINQVARGKRPMPSDPARRAIYEVQMARLEARRDRKEAAGKNAAENDTTTNPKSTASAGNETSAPNDWPSKPSPEDEQQARRREEHLYADLELEQLASMPPDQRFNEIMGMSTAARLEFANSLRGGNRQEVLEGLSPKQKETLIAMINPGAAVTSELSQAKLLRAIYSQRQLEEVMTDFWFNHFNVFVDKGLDRLMLTSYERDVIRPHVFGKFEELLVATAMSPAMLYYLDNWLSVGPNSELAAGFPKSPRGPYGRPYPRQPRPNQGKRPSGLNENYGRELLELHTLSVNGGYSQHDVTEVAKVFTGWTIDKPAEGGGFKFDPRMHEPGPKFVLGGRIKPKGEGEGLELLHRLAASPQTARFISLKLAQRFVSDDPPPALVDRMAQTFLKKKGNIREVLSTLFHSPEFWDDAAYRAKVKTPLEFLASSLRATGAEVEDALPLTRQLNNLGMPLYGAQPPTGYSMKAATWVSSAALLNRMNFALALTAGKIKGVTVDANHWAGDDLLPSDSGALLSTLEAKLLAGGVSKPTHDSIAAQIEARTNNGDAQKRNNQSASKIQSAAHPPDISVIAGLLLGSPEFQRR